MKKNLFNIITQEELFNISLFGFSTALQMNPSYFQFALYLLFIFSFLSYLHSRLMAYKKQAKSLIIFVFDFIRAISLPVGLAFIGMAYSYKTFWLILLGISFLVLYIAIAWAFWSVNGED